MTFDNAQGKGDQEFELVHDDEGTLEYAPKYAKLAKIVYVIILCVCFRVVTFSSIHHLSIYFPANFGEDITQIYYIGLKGEFTKATRTGVVNAVYEARPMLKDHKQDVKDGAGFAQGPQF
jgi:hypothetical protein